MTVRSPIPNIEGRICMLREGFARATWRSRGMRCMAGFHYFLTRGASVWVIVDWGPI